MDSIIIQNVFDKLENYLPDEWKKIAFFAGYTKGSYSMKFFVCTNRGYIDCFNIPNINQMQLMLLFQSINKGLGNYRNTLSESER